ncbi:MAG: hypothetical protein GY803_28980, partial [Chloroflexi bacterium]|nr:hypothetical protein [Chloroflexota bacterium]
RRPFPVTFQNIGSHGDGARPFLPPPHLKSKTAVGETAVSSHLPGCWRSYDGVRPFPPRKIVCDMITVVLPNFN